MGCEYMIRLDEGDPPVTDDQLKGVLWQLPHYAGPVQYPDNTAFEFRKQPDATGPSMPDVYVIGDGHEIVICQFGDYFIATQVLGALVAEFVSESKVERVEVVKP